MTVLPLICSIIALYFWVGPPCCWVGPPCCARAGRLKPARANTSSMVVHACVMEEILPVFCTKRFAEIVCGEVSWYPPSGFCSHRLAACWTHCERLGVRRRSLACPVLAHCGRFRMSAIPPL